MTRWRTAGGSGGRLCAGRVASRKILHLLAAVEPAPTGDVIDARRVVLIGCMGGQVDNTKRPMSGHSSTRAWRRPGRFGRLWATAWYRAERREGRTRSSISTSRRPSQYSGMPAVSDRAANDAAGATPRARANSRAATASLACGSRAAPCRPRRCRLAALARTGVGTGAGGLAVRCERRREPQKSGGPSRC